MYWHITTKAELCYFLCTRLRHNTSKPFVRQLIAARCIPTQYRVGLLEPSICSVIAVDSCFPSTWGQWPLATTCTLRTSWASASRPPSCRYAPICLWREAHQNLSAPSASGLWRYSSQLSQIPRRRCIACGASGGRPRADRPCRRHRKRVGVASGLKLGCGLRTS